MSDLDEIRERIEKAQRKVVALCHGDERWVMRVPAQPHYDPDLVIGDGLRAGRELIAEVERLRLLVAEFGPARNVDESYEDFETRRVEWETAVMARQGATA